MATSWPDSLDADRRTSRPSLIAVLKKAQTLTKATGAAIALATNRAGEIECSLRSGWTAPPLGRSLLQEDSLTAYCLRSGERLLCEDTKTDPRVAATAIIDLGVRSLVLTPIKHEGEVVGVLTVFANDPDAFSALHLGLLDTAAREIGEALGGEAGAEITLSPRPLFTVEGEIAGSTPPAGGHGPVSEPDAIATPPNGDDAATQLEPVPETPSAALPSLATLDAAGRPQRSIGRWMLAMAVLLLVAGGAIWIYPLIARSLASTTAGTRPSSAAAEVAQSQPAASASATLKIDPEAIVGQPTANFALDITLSRVPDIASVAMEINYDPNLMEFVSVAEAGSLPKDGQRVVLAHRDDPAGGILKVSAQWPPGSLNASGNGTVLNMVFRARKKGTGSVAIASSARDSQGQSIDVLGSHASVTIN